MVCTDAVARGMDLGTVDCVISYDPPKFVKNYIHRYLIVFMIIYYFKCLLLNMYRRIGRTARAGRQGTAITLITPAEKWRFSKLIESAEKKTLTPLQVDDAELAVYEDQFRSVLSTLKMSVKEEEDAKIAEGIRNRRRKTNFRPKLAKAKTQSTAAAATTAAVSTGSIKKRMKRKRHGNKSKVKTLQENSG